MIPIREIIPGFVLPEDEIITYAMDQPEYIPLPTWKGSNGLRISCWKLTWIERLQVLLGGRIWLRMLTFNKPLQPVLLETTCPLQAG